MLVSEIKEQELNSELIDRVLFQGQEDSGERADCILVLGSTKAAQYRVPVAVEAYRAGRAAKIMVCGGTVREFAADTCSEAAYMRKAALDLGVAEEDILVEDSSQNTVENILFGLVQLQRAFWLNRVHRVLLVTAAYHMRRSLAIARYFFPKHITVIPCPANDNSTGRDTWMKSPKGIQRVKDEVMNIITCVKEGVIPDFEV